MTLMDSDVCIDILREYAPALSWFAGLDEVPSIPGFCAVELVVGADDRRELETVRRFLGRFDIVWPEVVDMEHSLAVCAPLHLSHGLGALDSLIAGLAVGRSATLLTFNSRHFRAVPGITLEQPYAR
jgi:predicted nucleic acid-binding protein